MLFDGGMGTMLMQKGLAEWEIPETWNIERREDLVEIHAAYIEAGAEVIQTNTFGASRIKLSSSDAGKKLDVVEVNRSAVEAVAEAIKRSGRDDVFIAGDIGPTGKFLPPVGDLSLEDARKAFREQAKALDEGGVDLFLIETMFDVREAVEAMRAVRDVSDKPVVVELTFEKKQKGFFTMMGTSPEDGIEVLLKEGADVLGANWPNAGKPEMEHGRPVYKQKPEEFAADMMKIVKIGADAVGGCCGTNPDFIRALHSHLIRGE